MAQFFFLNCYIKGVILFKSMRREWQSQLKVDAEQLPSAIPNISQIVSLTI